jgi:tryptophan-rich sensory protein
VLFARVSTLAAALLVPYLAWVAFATVLNFALWKS